MTRRASRQSAAPARTTGCESLRAASGLRCQALCRRLARARRPSAAVIRAWDARRRARDRNSARTHAQAPVRCRRKTSNARAPCHPGCARVPAAGSRSAAHAPLASGAWPGLGTTPGCSAGFARGGRRCGAPGCPSPVGACRPGLCWPGAPGPAAIRTALRFPRRASRTGRRRRTA